MKPFTKDVILEKLRLFGMAGPPRPWQPMHEVKIVSSIFWFSTTYCRQ